MDTQRRDLSIGHVIEDRVGYRHFLTSCWDASELPGMGADEDRLDGCRPFSDDQISQLRTRIEGLLMQPDDRSGDRVAPLNLLTDIDQLEDDVLTEERGDVFAGYERSQVGIDDRLR